MQPAQFDYHRPGTLSEAIGLLESTDGARLIAGGHSLLPAMKLRVSNPTALIDISRLDGLGEIMVDRGGHLVVGALATHAAVAASDTVAGGWPAPWAADSGPCRRHRQRPRARRPGRRPAGLCDSW